MAKMIIGVVGRSGAGKDTFIRLVQKRLREEGIEIPSVASYTDRPMRPGETQGKEHTFLTKEEMDIICKNQADMVAYTKIGDIRYCVDRGLLESIPAQVIFYTLDPKGVDSFKQHLPEMPLWTIYVTADRETRLARAEKRNGDRDTFLARDKAEDEQFSEFEQRKDIDYILVNDGSRPMESICEELLPLIESAIEERGENSLDEKEM